MERDGTRVFEAGEWGRFQSAPASPLFPYYIRRMSADVLVVHVPNPTAELSYLVGRPRGRLVVRYHSDVVRQASAMRLYKPFLMNFLSKAVMILPTSEQYVATSETLQEVLARSGRDDLMRVVPLGIMPDEFATPDAARVAELRARYGGGSGYVLFTGRHRYYKGLPNLVRAAARISVPVVISGDGPERAGAERLARELNVRVFFPGLLSQADLVDHLHGCDVFAFPSVARSEAFGISILEAHACGKPVVATRLGTGVEFANEDGRTGYNVPPADPDAMAQAINALLADAPLRERMGTYARERVRAQFTAEGTARAEFELYREALG